jgi:hypothetical protein
MNTIQSDLNRNIRFSGRVAIQDLVLPLYRKTIYERLEERLDGGLGIFTGISPNTHGVVVSDDLAVTENKTVANRHFLGGPLEVIWQSGFTEWLESFRPDVAIVSGNARLFFDQRWRALVEVTGYSCGRVGPWHTHDGTPSPWHAHCDAQAIAPHV